jgi:hypothetical protein
VLRRFAAAATAAVLVTVAAAPAHADQPQSSAVRITVLDRTGAPLPGSEVLLVNPVTGGSPQVTTDGDGRGELTLPNGHWSALVRVVTPPAPGRRETITMVVEPDFVLAGERTLVLDARAGRRVTPPVVQGRRTQAVDFTLSVSRTNTGVVGWQNQMQATAEQVRSGDVYVTPTSTVSTGVLETATLWRLEPTGPGGRSAPDSYLVFDVQDHLSAGPKILTNSELHRMVQVVHHPYASSAGSIWIQVAASTRYNADGAVIWREVERGSTETELVTADPRSTYRECVAPPNEAAAVICQPDRSYHPGEHVDLYEGRGLHGDLVAGQMYQAPGLMSVTTGLSDGYQSGRVSDHQLDSVRTTLYRNGVQVGTAKTAAWVFDVSDERADFRLVSQIGRHVGAIRADTNTVWTFASEPPNDGIHYDLAPPALVVDYGPDVDGSGTASRSRDLHLDLTVSHFAGSTSTAHIGVPVVSWTNDDGLSWHPAKLRQGHDGAYAVSVPAKELRKATAVGVRVRAADSDGNTVDQTQYGLVPLR